MNVLSFFTATIIRCKESDGCYLCFRGEQATIVLVQALVHTGNYTARTVYYCVWQFEERHPFYS